MMTSKSSFLLLISFFFLAADKVDTPPTEQWEVIEEESNFSLEGTSNLHDWSCNVPEFDGSVSMDRKAMGKWPEEKIPFVVGTDIRINVKGIDCGKSSMDKNLQEALKAEDHPTIRFKFQKMNIVRDPSSLEKVPFSASGHMSIAGKTQDVQIPVVGRRLEEGRFSFSGKHTIDMTDYDVDPPTAMWGSMRTGKEVEVSYTVIVER